MSAETVKVVPLVEELLIESALVPNRRGRLYFDAAETIKELKSECAALRKDAERYRKLRNNMTFHEVDGQQPVLAEVSKRFWYHATDDTTNNTLDAAIDAIKE